MNGENSKGNSYLSFKANCREAMTFYKESLEGELELMPFEGSEMKVPDDYKDKIMHARLSFGDATIMASDSFPEQKLDAGNNIHISIAAPTTKKAEKYFNNLSEGGKVTFPLQETFWALKFGSFIDRFGISWMIGCELKE